MVALSKGVRVEIPSRHSSAKSNRRLIMLVKCQGGDAHSSQKNRGILYIKVGSCYSPPGPPFSGEMTAQK